jgi:drug/metabolite transporter (DMT)-like permease
LATIVEPRASAAVESHPDGLTFADLMLFICVAIWAFNVPLIKNILSYLSPLSTSIIRFGVAGLVLLAIVWFKERSLKIEWRHLPLMLLCSAMGIFLNQVFFVYALSNTSSSEVSLLMGLTPTFAVLGAWVFGHEKANANFWRSLPISFAGVILIVLTAPNAHLSGGWLGDILAICTAASWAFYTVLIRPLMRHYSILKLSAYITLFGTFMLLPVGLPQMNMDVISALPLQIWLSLIFATLAAVVLTNILWYYGVKKLGGPRTAFYAYLQPFMGVMAAALVLGEKIVIWQILGGVLIILGMLVYRRISKIARPRLQD